MTRSSRLKFGLSLVLTTSIATPMMLPDLAQAGWFGNCLVCKWDPWGGPAFCATTDKNGWWGCYATGYKCLNGGQPCGKKAPTPGVAP